MKPLLTFLLFNALTFPVIAQDYYLKGGFNYSTSRLNYNQTIAQVDTDMEFISGFNVGVGQSLKLKEKTAFDLEFSFSRKGNKPDPRLLGESDLKLNYWNLGSFFRLDLTSNLSLFAGPELGLLFPKPEDTKDRLNSFDLGLATGIRWRFVEKFAIDMRYVHGFLNTLKSDNFELALRVENGIQGLSDSQYRNSSFQFSIVHYP